MRCRRRRHRGRCRSCYPGRGPVVGVPRRAWPPDRPHRPARERVRRPAVRPAPGGERPAHRSELLRRHRRAGRAAAAGGRSPFTQFYWPTVSSNCIGEGLHSTASALVVPGPATTPAPGAGPGEATFVFTALGTPAAAPEQGELRAYWINIDNLRTGVTQLGNNQINPLGPATLSGTANTGPGRVLAVIDGHVRTADNVCAFAPTAATFSVR
ncbi:Rv1157c family protein [Corynebacterium aquatimens]|uniref:Rv1157c family protein n=1 Tax=Corynebacterium aquatimens TaxID=1190508 RepID=UPI003EBC1E4E